MKGNGKLSSNMEDYLEAIIVIQKNGVARVKNLAMFLDVKTSSVTSALNTLSRQGLVLHEKYGYAELTPQGEKLAKNVFKKHRTLVKFLTEVLSIHPKIAAEDACKMEHNLSPQTFRKLTKFIEFVETCPDHDRPDWLKSFDYFFKRGKRPKCRVRLIKERERGVN